MCVRIESRRFTTKEVSHHEVRRWATVVLFQTPSNDGTISQPRQLTTRRIVDQALCHRTSASSITGEFQALRSPLRLSSLLKSGATVKGYVSELCFR